ncbi:MAG: hypothetical protein JKX84_09685 [Flavobacteriales bacterium]|nr:hypothetical protein [Flavobacteriales bacterium]
MNTIDLKNILIHRISEIQDVSFLESIKTILDAKSDKEVLSLSTEQRNEIIASKKEITSGLFVEQDNLDNEFLVWLNEK